MFLFIKSRRVLPSWTHWGIELLKFLYIMVWIMVFWSAHIELNSKFRKEVYESSWNFRGARSAGRWFLRFYFCLIYRDVVIFGSNRLVWKHFLEFDRLAHIEKLLIILTHISLSCCFRISVILVWFLPFICSLFAKGNWSILSVLNHLIICLSPMVSIIWIYPLSLFSFFSVSKEADF